MNKHEQEVYNILEFWESYHRTRGNEALAADYLRRMKELRSLKKTKRVKIPSAEEPSSKEQKRWKRKHRRLERKSKDRFSN
jgi:hypothetical protein